MRYSKGIMWLDDCRIPHSEEIMIATDYKETKQSENGWNTKNRILEPSNRGRFTPNLLVCDDMLNDGNITQGTKTKVIEGLNKGYEGWGMNKKKLVEKSDKGTSSRYYDLDKWFDKVIDEIQ